MFGLEINIAMQAYEAPCRICNTYLHWINLFEFTTIGHSRDMLRATKIEDQRILAYVKTDHSLNTNSCFSNYKILYQQSVMLSEGV